MQNSRTNVLCLSTYKQEEEEESEEIQNLYQNGDHEVVIINVFFLFVFLHSAMLPIKANENQCH